MALRADDVDLGRDRALVEQYQQGDAAAFEDLYRRYYGRLFRFCLRRTGDPHEAEEVTQEAFARAYRAMPMLRGERRFYPWLSVIASRLCIDSHRRQGRTEPSAEVDPGAVSDPDPIDAAVNHDLLHQALQRLTDRHREVLHLREREGWSYQRIADHYDISMGAVEGLLFRARQALRREFLSIAGPEAGLAAAAPLALPFLARLRGRMAGWRLRASEWMQWANVPAVAANTVGVAMVVTTAAGLVGSVVSPSTPPPMTLLAAASAAAPPVSAAAPAVAVAGAAAVAPVSAPTSVADPPAVKPAAPARDDRLVRTGQSVDYDTAKDRAGDGDVAPQAGPVVAGVYVNQAAEAAQETASDYVAQLRGEQP